MSVTRKQDIEKIELELFLDAIYQRYGYDFRHYTMASVRRRVRYLLAQSGCSRISELIPKLLYDEDMAQSAIYDFSVTTTEMFRDPEFYLTIRQTIVPYLKTYPFIKVWHAGCATGEEVYSMAILLQEEGLYDQATIFATDFNEAVLDKAKEGIYPLKAMRQYTTNYQHAGGTRSFAEYYRAQYESAILSQTLKKNITFASHNLVTDGVFSETHMVFCRNVLIYFDKTLQNRVLSLFADSLGLGGFLCLGGKETLQFSNVAERFKVVNEPAKIYQKRTA